MHAALLANFVCKSTLHHNQEQLKRFKTTPGFIIDECMMLNQKIMSLLQDLCQQFPLEKSLRCEGRSKLFGYRSLLLCGDLRQIPPASEDSPKPFWATNTFQHLFEIFVLKEDRRHARSPGIRRIKELVAWGGCDLDVATGTSMQDRLHIFGSEHCKDDLSAETVQLRWARLWA